MIRSLITSLLFAGILCLQPAPVCAQNSTYKITTGNSLLVWYCQENQEIHSGSFMFSEGNFTTNGNQLSGGSFEIDMTAIVDNDLKNKQENKALVDRLSSADFFNIKDHPRAKYVIDRVELIKQDQYMLEGTLTLKGKSRPFRIPVVVRIAEGKLEMLSDTALIEGVQFGIKTGTQSPGQTELKNFKIRISQLFAKKI